MTGDELLFFNEYPQTVPLYAAFREALEARVGPVELRVQKSQITYINPRVFGCVSLPRLKRDREEGRLLVTFGLGRRVDSPRIAIATEPYPGRWTHHVLVGSVEEIDGELLGWVEEAYWFAGAKKR